MRKLPSLFLALLTSAIACLVAPSPEADPPEPGCSKLAPCTTRQLVALPPDAPENGVDPGMPLTELQEDQSPPSGRTHFATAAFLGGGEFNGEAAIA
jgi:hypothetical protein